LTKIATSELLEEMLAALNNTFTLFHSLSFDKATKMSASTSSPKHSQSEPKEVPGAWNSVNEDKEDTSTPYMKMFFQANAIPTRYNIFAALSSWLTLAGFIVVPGTFTSLRDSETLANNRGGKVLQNTVQNLPLLPVAGVLCLCGTIGMCGLWWTFRRNYVWLIRQIFL
jgi:hypothetical protein